MQRSRKLFVRPSISPELLHSQSAQFTCSAKDHCVGFSCNQTNIALLLLVLWVMCLSVELGLVQDGGLHGRGPAPSVERKSSC